jgi:hypothetical protein
MSSGNDGENNQTVFLSLKKYSSPVFKVQKVKRDSNGVGW